MSHPPSTINLTTISMNANKQALKLPGASKVRGKQEEGKGKQEDESSHPAGSPLTLLHQKDLDALLKKGSFLDLSSGAYMLESDEFLLYCPNVIKELDLSSNALIQLSSLKGLNKLKRLFADNNVLVSVSFHGLSSLVLLSLQSNRLVSLEDMSELKKLVSLDLSANRISSSFDELAKLKALKLLDLQANCIDLPIQNFVAFLLEPLKRLPKLEYLSFLDNPVETSIPEFRCFIAQELPRLKYLDWLPITKEEKAKAAKLDSEGFWSNKNLPVDSTRPRPTTLPDLAVRHSVSYNKDTLDFSKTVGPNGTGSASAPVTPTVNSTPTAAPIAPTANTTAPPTANSVASDAAASRASQRISTRRAPPSRAPSERFDGDFSALDAMIEEFEGASQELMMSRSSSNTPASPTSGQTHFTSFDMNLSNISSISSPPPVTKTSSQDALGDLLSEFESIAPSPSYERSGKISNASIASPTPTQFNDALARTPSNSSYEKYPEDAQILSNIDRVIESTGSTMDKSKSKKFATNVVRSDFPDAFFADELEAALSELEASLDFPELAVVDSTGDSSHARSGSDFNLSDLSEIESTLNELANTSSTPSKSDISDTPYRSPYSTPTHNISASHLSPYTTYQSNSARINTPLPSQAKPPASPRHTPDSNPASPAGYTKKTLPRTITPPSALKKPASPRASQQPLSPISPSHSFASSFDLSSASLSPSPAILPESPKIHSRTQIPTLSPREEVNDIPIVQEPMDDEDVLDKLISSLSEDTSSIAQDDPQMPTMLRPRRPLSAVFVPPVSHPALSTLPPAQLPPSIIKTQEQHHHNLQQQQQLLQKQQQIHEQEQQHLALQRQLQQQQQQLEQLQQQQQEREKQMIAERERERLQREQIAYREKVLQQELQQQREMQIQKELLLQTELKQKEMQAEALLQQQRQNSIMLQQQALQQQALQQQQQQAELAARKLHQQEEEQRMSNMTAQIISFNNLTINAKIGAGSFGDVHVAVMRYAPTVKLPPKDVTVKKIRMQRFNDHFLGQFKQEVESFSVLPAHPNILPLVGGCVEVVICTIHDFADGISLGDTKGIAELGSNMILQIARSIVAGLQALHAAGKMHRSLKPSNVILANPTASNPLKTVKLRDYGFTDIKDAIIKAGQAPGPYLAPEIIASPTPVYTNSVDTFAFGMTLWFMLTGEPPFPGMHPKKMGEALAEGIRPPVPQSVPAPLAKLIAACWNTDPNARPPLDTVARILNMSEAKLFAGYSAVTTNPPQPTHQLPQPPVPESQPPVQQPQRQQTQPAQQSSQPTQSTQNIPGSRINTVLAKVIDTLVQKAANQIPKACRLLEVINQPEVIPAMIEKSIPKYLVDMLNTQADSTDIEAVLRTLQILSSNEQFAQTLCSPDMLSPILNLVAPHAALTNVARSSYVVRNQYLQPAAKVIYAIVSHASLLIVLRDRLEMETLIAFTDSLKDSQNHIANQSNDDATFQILGVLNQLLTTAKVRNYFLSTSGLDAALFHVSTGYAPLRLQVADLLFLLITNPTHTSPATLLQDSFARNPASILHLVTCVASNTDTVQARSHACQALKGLALMSWSSSSPLAFSGSSRTNLQVNYSAIIASLQAAAPRLISVMASCKPGSDAEGLLVNICETVTAMLGNPEINASTSISKLDQLAIFAQLQNLTLASPSLQSVLQLAHRIVKLRDDTANLQGELGMCMPQLIQFACSASQSDSQLLALDFLAHIAGDAQHAPMMVDMGIVRPLVQLLEQTTKISPQISSLALKVLATLLASNSEDKEALTLTCTGLLSCGGVPVVAKYVAPTSDASSERTHSCEWAVAVFYELSIDATGRTSIITEKVLPILVGVGMHSAATEKTIEGVLGVISQFCSPQYRAALNESNAINAVAMHLQSSHEPIISLALKSTVQLARDAGGKELMQGGGVAAALQTVQARTHINSTLLRAAAKIQDLLTK